MIDYLVLGEKPISAQYPEHPVAQNETHWAGVIRVHSGDPCPIDDCEILAAIETNGANTWDAMIASLSPEQLELLRSIHAADGPIVTFSFSE